VRLDSYLLVTQSTGGGGGAAGGKTTSASFQPKKSAYESEMKAVDL
jgi:hypothetical protein